MNALQSKIAALQAAVTALVAANASAKAALAQAQADLVVAQASAFSQADLDAIQAVTDSATAAVTPSAPPAQ